MHAISLLHRLTSVTRVSALTDAIARSFTTGEPERPALSSMRALGRRQLSGVEVLAQSVATTAPAVSMVILPLTMLTHDRLVDLDVRERLRLALIERGLVTHPW